MVECVTLLPNQTKPEDSVHSRNMKSPVRTDILRCNSPGRQLVSASYESDVDKTLNFEKSFRKLKGMQYLAFLAATYSCSFV